MYMYVYLNERHLLWAKCDSLDEISHEQSLKYRYQEVDLWRSLNKVLFKPKSRYSQQELMH